MLCSLNLFRSESFVVLRIELSKKKGPGSSSCVSSFCSSCVAAGLAECSSMVTFGSRSFKWLLFLPNCLLPRLRWGGGEESLGRLVDGSPCST